MFFSPKKNGPNVAEIKGEEFVGGLVGLTRHYIGNRIGNFEKIDTNGEFKNREYESNTQCNNSNL